MSSRPAASSTASEIAIPRLPGESGLLGEHRAAGLRVLGRAGDDLRSPGLDQRAPERLLVVRDPDHVDLALEPHQLAGERERAPPLPGSRLGREPRPPLLLVVEGLRDGRVRLVAPRRADALVLVEDPRARADRLLQPLRAIERRRPPQPPDVEHLLGDRDLGLLAHLLLDERHREERRQIVRPDRLAGARVQHGLRRVRHVGADVVPARRQPVLVEQELGLLHLSSVGADTGKRRGLTRRLSRQDVVANAIRCTVSTDVPDVGSPTPPRLFHLRPGRRVSKAGDPRPVPLAPGAPVSGRRSAPAAERRRSTLGPRCASRIRAVVQSRPVARPCGAGN